MVPAPNSDQIYAIVLAAGGSSRFGSSKQIAAWEDGTLVRHAVTVAAESCGARSILLAGHDWQAVQDACKPLPGFMVINTEYVTGMGSSLALAVRAIRHTASAIIVMLADQPLVNAQHLGELKAAWSGKSREIVASAYADTIGAPALFASGCFDKLASLRGDDGARTMLQDPSFDVRSIEFEDAAADVDTVDDLARIARSARS